jgi:hypothetical protein
MGDKVPYLPQQTKTDYKREYTKKKPPKIPLAQTDPPRRYYFVKEYEKTHIYPHPMEKETNYKHEYPKKEHQKAEQIKP